MESPHITVLREALQSDQPLGYRERDLLIPIDHLLSQIAADLRVTYVGPGVGIGSQPNLHRLCVAEHHWTGAAQSWGAAVCSLADPTRPRAEWRLPRVSRERVALVLHALPEFFAGYAEVSRAECGDRPSVQRLADIAQVLSVCAG